MKCGIRAEPRLDKGDVVGVRVEEVWLGDEHWGAIPGHSSLDNWGLI